MSERMRVANWDRWGKLVKSWATGENRLEDGNSYPIPRSLEEFKAQCAMAQVGATIPPEIKAFAVMQYDPNTLVLRLPPKARVEASEQSIRAGHGSYPLPEFYGPAFAQAYGAQPNFRTIDEVLAFNDMRVGDYTIAYCG
jgi:hypothetical protein